MKFLPILIVLLSCTAKEESITGDILKTLPSIAETVMTDIEALQNGSPTEKAPLVKF